MKYLWDLLSRISKASILLSLSPGAGVKPIAQEIGINTRMLERWRCELEESGLQVRG